jgi:general secretion pathway protein K
MNCRRSSLALSRGQRGAALVIAMLVFALCTALIVAMKNEFTLFYQRGSNTFVAEQAYAYLRGAEDLASMALLLDYDQDQELEQPRDDLEELWAQPAMPYTLDEGGWLQGKLEDLQGRINLNALQSPPNEDGKAAQYTAVQQQFIRLLQALPDVAVEEFQAKRITQSISDWLDGDSIAAAEGAEDDFYFSQTPAYRAANQPMGSVSELRAVANVSPELFLALAPWVSALPSSISSMNIHTAPAMLLRTINEEGNLEPLSEEQAESLVAYRTETGFTDLEEFLEQPAFNGKDLGALRGQLTESSDYFLLSAEAEVADRRMQLYSVLERRGRAVNTLVRASGSL